MRTLVAITGVFAAVLASRAAADEIPVTSRLATVTVFPAGAEATRAARLALAKGEHTLIFDDLPAEAVPGSIRVDGKATAGLDIQSVDTRRRYIPRADQEALQAERKGIEDEIEKLRDERGLVQGQEDAAQTQKRLLQNLAQMPGHPQPEEGQPAQAAQPIPHTDWQQVLSLIGSGMTEAQRMALDAEVKKRDLDRRIEDLEKKLSALAPGRSEQTEVKVFVVAAAPLEADLTVRYQVRNAGWAPRYDARLATGSKTAPPLLELARRADIVQRTGESWDNIALLLSTTRPTANAAAPTIDTVTVDFEPEAKEALARSAPPPAPMAAYDGLAVRKKAAPGAGAESAAAEAAPELDVAEQGATIETAPFQAVFAVPGRLTVPSTGEAKRVFLQQDGIEPVLSVRTVPKLDAKAYLYAKLILPKGSPLLPGAVSLFRDGTFVGTGTLPVLSPGEEHELGFGADDQVRVRHAIADEKRGETGLISSARTDSRNYRITVKNMHERAVELVVHDHIPVSQNDDIKVEFVGPAQPSKKDIDGKRGVIAFESKLGPEEERLIEFGYRVIWPGARAIVYH
ncbi:MAG: mucoidy inhibitor MuiA family protein [Hyphomicrobium sp.]|uniref:mucoidy inhibitor MuiA family protein n=1 Tax=Hyphomicrobium sp. TaxID=82 RepID=UPI00132ABF46|nr:mucoidy inhibitor MuiA family protein [Hyphomicrobium sp.]KAB2940055.1 MAG: mucoidy inhibitor MuiA family protein [Hyphomicrobium sp.]MBZ0209572.1 mucoidy inhibitor MuiA family protein [Hyphomicrobium sp.]